MADKNRHRLQANKNERFFETFDLDNTPYLDWAVASLFYAALHLVDAYLAGHNAHAGTQPPDPAGGHHPKRHFERRQKLIHIQALSPIRNPYRDLHQRCDDARYNLVTLSPQRVKNLATNEYNTIKRHINALL